MRKLNKKYKLLVPTVLVDLDGTLLNRDKTISSINLKSIRDYTNIGGKIVIASGRSIRSASHFAKYLGTYSPYICFNGASIWDENDNNYFSKYIDSNSVEKIIMLSNLYKLEYILYTDEYLHIKEITNLNKRWLNDIPNLQNKKNVSFCKIDEVSNEDLSKILKIVILPNEDKKLRKLFKNLNSHSSFTLNYTERYIEVTHKDANKLNAFKFLEDQRILKMEDTMCIGDNYNDLEIIENAGIGIAMGNSCSDVKEVADKIVRNNDNNGVAEALYEFAMEEI